MAMKKCPVCGEKYSDTYKQCPFCAEEAALEKNGQSHRNGGHRMSQKESHLSTVLTLVALVLICALVYLLFGDAIAEKLGMSSVDPGGSQIASSSVVAPSISDGSASGSSSAEPDGSASSSSAAQPSQPTVNTDTLPENLKLSSSDFTMKVGEAPVKLTASGGSGAYQWMSDNEAVATVDSSGNVVAVSAGTANIIATDGSGKGTCIVRVKGTGTVNTGNTGAGSTAAVLSREDFTLPRGDSYQLTLSGETGALSWSSSNTSVATVDGSGRVTAVGSGTATISVSWDGNSRACIVRVP